MAISTFAELKSAVASWADRSDLTSTIPDFITLTESAVNNGDGENQIDPLRVREMETAATVTVTSSVGTLPTDYVDMKRVYSATSGQVLKYATPEWYLESYPEGDGGMPVYYTIIGTSIYVSTDVAIIYYAKVPALSDSATTNWLLTKSPNVYLFGALFFLEVFAMNPEGAAGRRAMFATALAGLAKADKANRAGSFVRSSAVQAQ